jgi:hypothetical protein
MMIGRTAARSSGGGIGGGDDGVSVVMCDASWRNRRAMAMQAMHDDRAQLDLAIVSTLSGGGARHWFAVVCVLRL